MSFDKSGIISTSAIYESAGTNLLVNSEKYTKTTPYILTGTSIDDYRDTDQYAQVNPGETYYLISQTDTAWNSGHGTERKKVTIWLYISETYNPSYMGYKNPVCFHSGNWISPGIWRYTIDAGCHMVRVRYNNYSDGKTSITAKFWDTKLIPAKYFVSTPPSKIRLFTLRTDLSLQEKSWNIKLLEGGDLV